MEFMGAEGQVELMGQKLAEGRLVRVDQVKGRNEDGRLETG